MTIAVSPIDRAALEDMQCILSQSAGYEVSLPDELAYFESLKSTNWFLARSTEGKAVGFIRSFPQGANWSLGEFYVDSNFSYRGLVANRLLAEFSASNSYEQGHRLRIDVPRADSEMNERLEKMGFSQKKQLFRHFVINLDSSGDMGESSYSVNGSGREIAEVLSHLHPVSESEASKWTHDGTIRTISSSGRVVAAAQFYSRSESAEINRIATHSCFLRQGHAKKLLMQICRELSNQGKKQLFLKVEDIIAPAIEFYRDFGF
jgi:ribosomal protein S18 acetylase RimI-like enzyme